MSLVFEVLFHQHLFKVAAVLTVKLNYLLDYFTFQEPYKPLGEAFTLWKSRIIQCVESHIVIKGFCLDKFSVWCALSPPSVLLIEVLVKALKAPSIIVDVNKPGVNY